MRFSEKETYQFVKTYFKQEHLWNTRHLAYKSNQRRLIAYRALIEEFSQSTGIELSLTQLRMKIKNLKSTYLQELHKITHRADYKPAMKWFAVWHKHIQSINSRESLEESNTTDDENPKTWLSEGIDNDSVDPFESSPSNDYLMAIKPEPKSKHDQSNSYNRSRSFENSASTDISVSDLNVTESNMNSAGIMRDDEFDIYGKYVASQLRSMDLQRALTLQLEIQNLVSGARLAELSDRRDSDSVIN
ncbi:jg12249 [Pararge aegeria aegeria]|uniref:Jg12249 protein n=1 Tax=Pararge aegeria aegeria TaxID=348720 RepID=A0A8S4S783_9NEOP|nr:jg12249 [Pararge aegeria aegeria]